MNTILIESDNLYSEVRGLSENDFNVYPIEANGFLCIQNFNVFENINIFGTTTQIHYSFDPVFGNLCDDKKTISSVEWEEH